MAEAIKTMHCHYCESKEKFTGFIEKTNRQRKAIGSFYLDHTGGTVDFRSGLPFSSENISHWREK